jgi:hypothetical protein
MKRREKGKMRQFDQSSAECQVFTYKEGLLSRFAHDLRISVTSFVIVLGQDHGSIEASFDAESLLVDCAMVNGVARPDLLAAREKEEINLNIMRDVLDTRTFREIHLKSSSVAREDSAYVVTAALTLHGATREISFAVNRGGGQYIADVRLNLPDFGIKPFTALFGTLRIRPDILIRVMIPRTYD